MVVPSPFVTPPHLDGDSRLEETGKENGPTSLVGHVLSTAKPMEEPDELQIPTSQLATPAADYPSPAHPLSLSEN